MVPISGLWRCLVLRTTIAIKIAISVFLTTCDSQPLGLSSAEIGLDGPGRGLQLCTDGIVKTVGSMMGI